VGDGFQSLLMPWSEFRENTLLCRRTSDERLCGVHAGQILLALPTNPYLPISKASAPEKCGLL
jgi:hypothetical protein